MCYLYTLYTVGQKATLQLVLASTFLIFNSFIYCKNIEYFAVYRLPLSFDESIACFRRGPEPVQVTTRRPLSKDDQKQKPVYLPELMSTHPYPGFPYSSQKICLLTYITNAFVSLFIKQ
jgi:hypothetical protein